MLKNLILYPEEARHVAAETVARVEAAPPNDAYLRPVIFADGTMTQTPARPVHGVPLTDERVAGDAPATGPRLLPAMPHPLRWVAHAVEAAVHVRGHVLMRREGWLAEDLAATGLGLIIHDLSGERIDNDRDHVRRWLFDPRRDESDVLAVLRFAAATGIWCIYEEETADTP